MIGVCLVSGFLGAGKSTWLARAMSTASPGARTIVNDMADEMPDADLVDGAGVIRLVGGCVCCDISGELVAVLRRLVEQRHAGQEVDSIVIETSGISDPNNVAELVRTDPVLRNNLVLGEVVVVVDALLGRRSLRHEPLVGQQIAAADRIIVTKTDLGPPSAGHDVVATLKALAPTAAIEVTPNPHGIDPGAVSAQSAQSVQSPQLAPSPRPSESLESTTLRLHPDVDWTVLAGWLAALLHARGDRVLRLKGRVRTANGTLGLSAVQGLMHAPRPMAPTAEDPSLVIVARGLDPDALAASWADFSAAAGCHVNEQPRTEVLR